MSSADNFTYSYILVFITRGSNAKYIETAKILSRLKITSSKSVAVL